MRYAGIIKNDIAAGKKVNLTFFTQGCPIHCKDCHNPEAWDFNGGKEFTNDTLKEILQGLNANDVQRNFSVMGGEPLCDENLFLTDLVITSVREHYPDILIYVCGFLRTIGNRHDYDKKGLSVYNIDKVYDVLFRF